MTPEQNTNPMNRPCALCGERIGAHVVKAYGVHDERAGAMGLICPPMLTPAEKARVAQAEAIEASNDFDKDLARLEEIRATVRLAASTTDVVFLLEFIDKLWAEYSRTLQQLDDEKYGPLFSFPTRRETQKAMDAVSEYVRSEVSLNRMLSKTIAAACGITALDDRQLMERLKEVWVDGWRAHKEGMERKS